MEQTTNRVLITADEIRELKPLNAILKFVSYPAARVALTYIKYESKNASLLPDPTFSIEQYLAELASPVIPPPATAATEAPVVQPAQPVQQPVSNYRAAWGTVGTTNQPQTQTQAVPAQVQPTTNLNVINNQRYEDEEEANITDDY